MKEGSHTGGFVSLGVCWCLLCGVEVWSPTSRSALALLYHTLQQNQSRVLDDKRSSVARVPGGAAWDNGMLTVSLHPGVPCFENPNVVFSSSVCPYLLSFVTLAPTEGWEQWCRC